MTREFTSEENRAWRAKQPQKMIVSKVVVRSHDGKVLLAKSSYKKSWQLPGGGVEDGESSKRVPIDTSLTTQEDEVTDFTFVDVTQAAPLLSPYYANFWKQHYAN